MSPVSRHRSGKKGSSRGGGPPKGARSGNPQVRAEAAQEQALRDENRTLTDRVEQSRQKLRRLQHERQQLIAERDRLAAGFSAQRKPLSQDWYEHHATALVADARRLAAVGDPDALEQACAEILADRLLVMREDGPPGWEVADWLPFVASAAADDQEPGSWYLLHGLIAICPPDLAAMMQIARDDRAAEAPSPSPSWLPLTLQRTIDPRARVISDAYGLRSAVLVPATRPDGSTATYLLDVDRCAGYPTTVRSGWHPDPDAALAAWADGVGASTDPSTGGPFLVAQVSGTALGPGAAQDSAAAAADVLGELLEQYQDQRDLLLGEDDPRERVVALLRDQRVVADLTDALAAAGVAVEHRTAGDIERGERWAAQETPGFRAWCGAHGLRPPPAGLVEAFLTEWASYVPSRLVWACSPHRVVSFTAQLSEEWADRDRLRQAWSLLEPWAGYCLEHQDLPEQLAAPVRDAARIATGAPHRTASRVVDTWKTATDETHPLEP
jgi:hypothetical protein